MADTGWLFVTSGANVDRGNNDWVNPGNITADDGSDSEVDADTVSDYLVGKRNMGVPSGATIDGLEMRYERHGWSGTAGQRRYTTEALRAVKGDVVQSTDRSDAALWPIFSSPELIAAGGATDLWGTTWADTDINSTGFGFALAAQYDSGSGGFDPAVDYMQIKVYYTEGGGGTIYTRTLSDSISVTENPVRGQSHGRVAEESLSLSDSISRGQLHGRVLGDSAMVNESLVRGQLHGRALTDSVVINESLRRYALLYRLTTDSFDVLDSLSSTVAGLFVRVLRDNVSIVDLVLRSQLHGRVLGDALVVTEAVVRSQLHGRTLSDSVALVESVFRTAFLYRAAQDSVETYDALVATITRASTDIGIVLMLLEQAQPTVAVLEEAQAIELSLELFPIVGGLK